MKHFLNLVLLIGVLVIPCHSNFVYISDPLTWQGAESRCRTLTRNLVSVHSTADLAAVKAVIPSSLSAATEVWIGGKYFGVGGTIDETNWQWTDYSPFEYANWSSPSPDVTKGECLTASRDVLGAFRNNNCEQNRPAVCGHEFKYYVSAASSNDWNPGYCTYNLASVHSLGDMEQVFARCSTCWVGGRYTHANPLGTTTWSDSTTYDFDLPYHYRLLGPGSWCVAASRSNEGFAATLCTNHYIHLCNSAPGYPQCNVRQVTAPLSPSELPASGIRVEVDMIQLTMTVHVLVEMVGARVTPIIDFTPFAGDMQNVTNCENRLRSDFRQVFWNNLWNDAHNPTGKDWHVSGVASNLMYPSTEGTKWTLTRLHCKSMYYTTTLTWNELYACRQRDGRTRSIEVIDTAESFGMRGAVYLTAVSPVDPQTSNNPLSDYYAKTLRQVPFQLEFSKSGHVSTTINSEIVDVSVLQEWVETINGTTKVMFRVRTRAANSLRLTSALILNPPADVVNPILTPESGHEENGCITEANAPGVCLQTWILSFDRQSCPHSYLATLTSRFIVECQTTTPGTSLNECNSIKQLIGNTTGVVSIEADIISEFYDIFCVDVSRFEFASLVVNLSSTLSGAFVPPSFPFAAGQSVFFHISPRDSALSVSGGIVSDYRLNNLWFCLGNGTGLVDAQPNGDGGCFLPSSVASRVKVHDGATSSVEPSWTVIKHQTSPSLVFEIKFPPITSAAIFLHVQVRIVPVLSGSSGRRRRSLLSSGGNVPSAFYQSSHTTVKIHVNSNPVGPVGTDNLWSGEMEIGIISGSCGVFGCLLAIGCGLLMRRRSALKREREMAETSSGPLGVSSNRPKIERADSERSEYDP